MSVLFGVTDRPIDVTGGVHAKLDLGLSRQTKTLDLFWRIPEHVQLTDRAGGPNSEEDEGRTTSLFTLRVLAG